MSSINDSPIIEKTPDKKVNLIPESFQKLIDSIADEKADFEKIQREISETKELWLKEQQEYMQKIKERDQEEEIRRRRDEETYQYEEAMKRKREENEYAEKKAKWEKELNEQKEILAQEKQELEKLRKMVAGFELEKEKAVKEACQLLESTLEKDFGTENSLKEQQYKAEKSLLELRLTNLTAENARYIKEIDQLKRSLEYATQQLKDIAVKVIESSNSKTPVTMTDQK